MSTIYNFHQDAPAATTPLQSGDAMLRFNTASGRVEAISGALVAAGAQGNAVVNTTATALSLTAAAHAGRIVTVSSTAPIAITLPASAGTGNVYTLQVQVAATATGHTIKVANTTDIMQGIAKLLVATTNTITGWLATATDDTITINGATKGGFAGDIIEFIDVKAGFWSVQMTGNSTGAVATPFSATV